MSTIETIVAIATPPGMGGVGIVRVSGPLCEPITTQLTHKKIKPKQSQLSVFYYEDKNIIDEGIVLYFPSPHSYTGEDVVEFQCHGSPIVLDQMVKRCIELGARLALPGEFSLRAFLNGKMDLVQAEAVADLINSHSQAAAKMALRSLQGDFSKHINLIHDEMVKIRVYIEAMIDFPDEEVDFLTQGQVEKKLNQIDEKLSQLLSKAKQGSIMREGITVVIAGPPNAGKSTLMNALSGREVAIVTHIAGTTRDVMREGILLEGVALTLVDTAGLRETKCLIEEEGIKRAYAMLNQADLIMLVSDANEGVSTVDTTNLPKNVPIIRIFNKIDKQDKASYENNDGIYIAAKSGEGLDLVKKAILKSVGFQPEEGVFIARRRHLSALEESKQTLSSAIQQLATNPALEFVAEDLRLSHQALSSITGEFSADDLLGEIFSAFCIGK